MDAKLDVHLDVQLDVQLDIPLDVQLDVQPPREVWPKGRTYVQPSHSRSCGQGLGRAAADWVIKPPPGRDLSSQGGGYMAVNLCRDQ